MIPEGTMCKVDGCEEEAVAILFSEIEVWNIKKEVKIPLCRTHHTNAIGNRVESLDTQPEGQPPTDSPPDSPLA